MVYIWEVISINFEFTVSSYKYFIVDFKLSFQILLVNTETHHYGDICDNCDGVIFS